MRSSGRKGSVGSARGGGVGGGDGAVARRRYCWRAGRMESMLVMMKNVLRVATHEGTTSQWRVVRASEAQETKTHRRLSIATESARP